MNSEPQGGVKTLITPHSAADYPQLKTGAAVLCFVLSVLFSVAGALCFAASPLFLLPAAVLFCSGTVASAFLFCWGGHIWRFLPALLSPVAAYFAAGFSGALFSLALFCGALVISICAMRRMLKYEAVAWMCAACCLCAAAGCVITLLSFYGKADSDALRLAITEITGLLTEAYRDSAETIKEIYPDLAALTDETIRSAMTGIVMLVPAYFAAAAAVMAYICVSFFSLIATKLNRTIELLSFFWLPRSAAYVFVIASLLSVFISASTTVGLVLNYITVLLTPGLALYGIRSLWMLVHHRFFPRSPVAAVGVIGVIFVIGFSFVLPLLAFLGALICARPAPVQAK